MLKFHKTERSEYVDCDNIPCIFTTKDTQSEDGEWWKNIPAVVNIIKKVYLEY